MRKIAFLFPGQGSQAVGMGADAAALSPRAAELFAEADRQLGFALSTLCKEGPEEELKKTENTQPALFVSSAMTLEVLREAGIPCDAVAGHSLGEYSALYAAETFTFEEGLSLVRTRGEAFAKAGAAAPGAMAAIIGLDGAKVRELCANLPLAPGGVLNPANYNDPTQTVISGDPTSIEAACAAAKEAGAKRAIVLPVSGAFHSPLVASAAEIMREAIAAVTLRQPRTVFVNNVDARRLVESAVIAESLVRQVTGSVRWVETIELLVSLGITDFVEVGSGKVLAGLTKRIAKEATVHSTESTAAIEATITALKS